MWVRKGGEDGEDLGLVKVNEFKTNGVLLLMIAGSVGVSAAPDGDEDNPFPIKLHC